MCFLCPMRWLDVRDTMNYDHTGTTSRLSSISWQWISITLVRQGGSPLRPQRTAHQDMGNFSVKKTHVTTCQENYISKVNVMFSFSFYFHTSLSITANLNKILRKLNATIINRIVRMTEIAFWKSSINYKMEVSPWALCINCVLKYELYISVICILI